MNKKIAFVWIIFIAFISAAIWLENEAPKEKEDSIIKHYKIVVNEDSISSAKVETTNQPVNEAPTLAQPISDETNKTSENKE